MAKAAAVQLMPTPTTPAVLPTSRRRRAARSTCTRATPTSPGHASFCTDFRMTKQTATRLAELDYTTAAFTHGPHLSDQPREQIRRFLTRQGMR